MIGSSKLPYYNLFEKGVAGGFDCLQPIASRQREELASNLTPCGMIVNKSHITEERSAFFQFITFC
jgi:hypothetical protein